MGAENLIEFPKPVNLIKHLINFISKGERNPIILDFFAGSCPTAHAVFELNTEDLELNTEDGNDRSFILVQLPEKCEEDTEAYRSGYATIADLGKERIRRVINKLKVNK